MPGLGIARLLDFTEEARERPLARKLARGLGVVQAVLMMHVEHIVIADGRSTRTLHLLIRTTLRQHFRLAEALAQTVKLVVVLRKRACRAHRYEDTYIAASSRAYLVLYQLY